MISDKERQLLNSLDNKEYREALAIEHVNTTLAIQIRKMRENKQWNQSDLAECLGKHQETISQWENPDYGRYSLTTLKKLAAAFDVALLVKFIPFSELVRDMVNLSDTRLSPHSFAEEQANAVAQDSFPSFLEHARKEMLTDANIAKYFYETLVFSVGTTAEISKELANVK